ncbi:MAG: glucose-1-phosphate adenylyltransferase [Chloroflexi bacterium]|nr:glucose-1-phosphate adenylyltransferase [Chloroflexota bacterium]
MEKVLAILMAGGAGERLQPLTRERSKAAVPYGGKFRIIDFTLSNCVNSGIRQIYVLTQYRSGSLSQHIQDGWGISSSGLGEFIYCVPAQQKLGADWYRGTADAVRQNLDLIRGRDIDQILVLSGDHIYKMDYSLMVAYHRRKKAEVTVAATRVRKEEAAGTLGVLEIDRESQLVGFQEKPDQPRTIPDAPDYAMGSMGIYIFNTDTAVGALRGDEDDFGKHIIPGLIDKGGNVFVYDYEQENKIQDFIVEVRDGTRQKVLVEQTRDSAYWRDVGTIDSYYEASMDLVGVDPIFNLYGQRWPIRTFQRPLPPSKCVLGGQTPESMVSDGCIISGGTAWNSILSPGVIIERGAVVERSIVFDDTIIEPGARVRRAIIDKRVRVCAGASLGYDLELDRKRGCSVSETGIVVVPIGTDIERSDLKLL